MRAQQTSLTVHYGTELLFSSDKKWLHPLFELEEFLANKDLDRRSLFLEDKIVGRGAAFLIQRLGIRKVHARLLSKRGKSVFEAFGIDHTWDELVEKIACMTEDLLENTTRPEEAYAVLKERARRAAACGRTEKTGPES